MRALPCAALALAACSQVLGIDRFGTANGSADAPGAGDATIDGAADAATDAAPMPDASCHDLLGFAPANIDPCLVPPSKGALVIASSATFDTSTGVLTNGGAAADVATATIDQVTAGAPKVSVLVVDSLSITSGGTLRVTGQRSLVIVAITSAAVSGTLDVSAAMATGGPGASTGACQPASPGGMTGSLFNQAEGGGGGGGFGTMGGAGGAVTSTSPASPGGTSGTAMLAPLVGGCPGAAGGTDGAAGPAGAGGGAIQISTPDLHVSGVIASAGGGGAAGIASGSLEGGGGGGGAGGAILLDAAAIDLQNAILTANGGGGGGGASGGQPGHDGAKATATAAAGGASTNGGPGGPGGTVTAGGAGTNGVDNTLSPTGGGGGGGGAGRIHLRVAPTGAPRVLSPAPQ